MICDRCGHINPNINKRCNKCGAPLERKTDQEKRKQGIVERNNTPRNTGLFSSISNLSSGKKIFILGAVLLLVVLAVASVTPNNDDNPLFADNNSTTYVEDVNNTPEINTLNDMKNNTTENPKKDSKISVKATSPIKPKQSTHITGHLTDTSNKAITYEDIKITIANNEYHVQTNYDGSYSFEFNDTDNGSQSVTVSYEGNENISGCYNSTFFEVIKENNTNNTTHQSNNTTNNTTAHNGSNNTTKHDTTNTTANNTPHNNSNQNKTTEQNNSNNDSHNKTNNDNKTINNTDKDNNTENNANNDTDKNNKTENNTDKTEHEKIDSKLSVDVDSNHPNENRNISGTLTDKDNNPIGNAQITIKIGDNTYTAHTDSQGRYSIIYSATDNKTDEIIVMFEGDSKYSDCHESTKL